MKTCMVMRRSAALLLMLTGLAVTTAGQAPAVAPVASTAEWTLRSFPKIDFPPSQVPEAQRLAVEAQRALNEGRFAQGVAMLELAVELDPAHPFAWWRLGSMRIVVGPREPSLTQLRRQIEVAPSAQAYLHTAFSLQAANMMAEAMPLWRDAVRLYPEHREIAALFGEALLASGAPAEAVTVLTAEVGLRPNSSRLRLNLARGLTRTKRVDAAVEHLRIAAGLEPTPEMWTAVANELAHAGLELDLALDYATRAQAAAEVAASALALPQDARTGIRSAMTRLFMAWDALAAVHARRGDLQRAVSFGLAAWRLSPNSGNALRLGQLMEASGDDGAAARHYALGAILTGEAATEAHVRLEALAGDETAQRTLVTEARQSLRMVTRFSAPRTSRGGERGLFYLVIGRGGQVQQALALSSDRQPISDLTEDLLKLSAGDFLPADSKASAIAVTGSFTCEANAEVCTLSVSPVSRSNIFGS